MKNIIYNIDFLIAGFLFFLLLMYHILGNRQWDKKSSRVFMSFLFVGTMNILFDIITTIFISLEEPKWIVATEISLFILYSLQILMPYAMFLYVNTLCKIPVQQIKRISLYAACPAILMSALILTNPWTHWLYRVTSLGIYERGPAYIIMYINGLGYQLAAALWSVLYQKEMGRKHVLAIREYLVISTICVVIQILYHDFLVIGYGVALSLTVFLLTTKNPYENTDNLTGVFDREYFCKIVQPFLDKKIPFYLIEVYLNDLKRINHIHGLECGNKLLKQTAQALLGMDRDSQVFRVGGNEFALLIDTAEKYQAAKQYLMEHYQKNIEVDGIPIRMKPILCGVKQVDAMSSCDEVLSYMEYLATTERRPESTIVEGNDKTLEGFWYLKTIQHYLDLAISDDLFDMVYQPIYSMSEKRYVSIEALSRLKHQKLGAISPALFFHLAEKEGQIIKLGTLQFERLCRFVKRNEWIMSCINNVKFNLSALEVQDACHMEHLIQLIYQYGLKPSYFQFEVTETTATEYQEELYAVSSLLQKEGIEICMDDFGAGYANLNSVLKLPFHVIKLDQSLINGICDDAKVALFYEQIASVFQRMGYQVVAEGVEHEAEIRLIGEWGVSLIQGYYYSKPLTEQELLQVLHG